MSDIADYMPPDMRLGQNATEADIDRAANGDPSPIEPREPRENRHYDQSRLDDRPQPGVEASNIEVLPDPRPYTGRIARRLIDCRRTLVEAYGTYDVEVTMRVTSGSAFNGEFPQDDIRLEYVASRKTDIAFGATPEEAVRAMLKHYPPAPKVAPTLGTLNADSMQAAHEDAKFTDDGNI